VEDAEMVRSGINDFPLRRTALRVMAPHTSERQIFRIPKQWRISTLAISRTSVIIAPSDIFDDTGCSLA